MRKAGSAVVQVRGEILAGPRATIRCRSGAGCRIAGTAVVDVIEEIDTRSVTAGSRIEPFGPAAVAAASAIAIGRIEIRASARTAFGIRPGAGVIARCAILNGTELRAGAVAAIGITGAGVVAPGAIGFRAEHRANFIAAGI